MTKKDKIILELENRIKDMQEHIIVDRQLMRELIDIETLKCEVNKDIEKVWMYDNSFPLSKKDMGKRAELIERVFYKVANEWNSISEPNDNEDGPYWCKYPDENGNKIPMTKVKGSRVMSEEEVKELNKIKLPF